MKNRQYFCDRCKLTLGEVEALHHRDGGHKIIDLLVDDSFFETVEKEAGVE